MIPNAVLESTPVLLPAMLDAREYRQEMQHKILSTYPYPLISFTLNIVGEQKVFPLSIMTYDYGVRAIETRCIAWGMPLIHKEEVREYTGYECFLSVDAPPEKIKKVLCQLEEDSVLGRLYDIDVINLQGEKLSREEFDLPPRHCLLCEEQAFVCARSRRHSVAELWNFEVGLMWDFFSQEYSKSLASIATRALLYEVSASPKPGLVDQMNTGSHQDMDIHTFEASALALLPYFRQFVEEGVAFAKGDKPLPALFPPLRPLGIQAELAMLEATKGVNTHKGIIFSMGIFLATLGYLYGKQIPYSRPVFRETLMELSQDLAKDFQTMTLETAVTHGELLYVHHGIRGIRGEALEGYPALFQVALPQLAQSLEEGNSLNDSGVIALLHILKETQDSNVIHRANYETMLRVQEEIKGFFTKEPNTQEKLDYVRQLDQSFIQENISPGGSADLLALTYFLHFYETDWRSDYGF